MSKSATVTRFAVIASSLLVVGCEGAEAQRVGACLGFKDGLMHGCVAQCTGSTDYLDPPTGTWPEKLTDCTAKCSQLLEKIQALPSYEARCSKASRP